MKPLNVLRLIILILVLACIVENGVRYRQLQRELDRANKDNAKLKAAMDDATATIHEATRIILESTHKEP